jgi:lipopolysaccharide exporter
MGTEVAALPPSIPDGPVSRRSVVTGVRWIAASQALLQVTGLVTAIVLARLLEPGDFGLLALTLLVTELLERVLGDVGTSAALVQKKTVSPQLVSSVFWFNVGVGALTCGALLLAAPVLASVLGDDRTAPILRVMGVAFVLLSLGLAQRAMLRRSLAFRRLATADVVGAFVQAVTSLALALRGWGVWSLVLGILAAKLVANIYIWVSSPWRPSWHFRWADIRQISHFSGNLTAYLSFSYLQEAGDRFIVGRFVGPTALGFYGVGYRLLFTPLKAILSVSRSVLFPTLARVQDDDAAISTGFVRASGVAALCCFPLTIGLCVLAEPAVVVLLGERWEPAVTTVRIFGVIGAIGAVTAASGDLFQAKGRTDLQLRLGVVTGLSLLLAYAVGARWGQVGVAWGFLVGTALLAYPLLAIPFRLVAGLDFPRLLRALAPIVVATAVMAVAAFACNSVLDGAGVGSALALGASIIAGALGYLAVLLITRPPAVADLVLLVRPARRGGPEVPRTPVEAEEAARPPSGTVT